MASALPTKLKSIGHYVKIANEHSQRDPAVYYWCLVYSVQAGMSIDKKSPECVQYLSGLLATLESVKKSLSSVEAVTNEVVAQAHLEQYALKLFGFADTQDRSGNFNKNVVKAFYTAGHLFDVITLFGELDEQLVQNRKYAKWKAAYIHNCLKKGETPIAGPLPEEGEEELGEGGDVTLEIPGSSVAPPEDGGGAELGFESGAAAGSSAAYGALPPAQTVPAEPSRGSAPESETGKAGGVNAQEMQQCQKLCKYAISALEYEDTRTAVDNLQKALRILMK